jgi:hypothetical protein
VVANFSNLWLWPLLLALFTIPFVSPVAMWASRWEPPVQEVDPEAYDVLGIDRKRRGRRRKPARREEEF